MIRAIRYKNFKKYKDVTVDISKKITILVGPNSSGKSSILKGMLAFKQTYDDPTDHAGFVSEGGYVDIGHFIEYVKDHEAKEEVTFAFEVVGFPNVFMRSFNTRIFRKAFVSISHQEDPQTKHGRVSDYTIFLCQADDAKLKDMEKIDTYIRYRRMQKSDEAFKVEISFALYKIAKHSSQSQVDIEEAPASYEKLSQKLSGTTLQAQRDNQRGMLTANVRGGFDASTDILWILEQAVVRAIHSRLVEDLTQKLFALAALREKPARSVKRTDERLTVGSVGENAASVYFSMRQKAIKAGKKPSKIREDFIRLENWFKSMRLGTDIEINSWRDLIDMRARTGPNNRRSDSVADIGVGFSQAAPILVQLAAMPDDGMLVTEQPELHLYPWAQVQLGKIFCEEAARTEKRIIIETHSEHLIGGVQVHVSEGRGRQTPALSHKDVQVLYVGEDSSIIDLELNEYGEFASDWPAGFFDQAIKIYQQIMMNKVR